MRTAFADYASSEAKAKLALADAEYLFRLVLADVCTRNGMAPQDTYRITDEGALVRVP